jgi:phage tail sheath protein FI
MMMHPPLYIEDTSVAPRFIRPLPSTIPLFIGHTKLAGHFHQPVTISSINEFVELFGDGGAQRITVLLDEHEPGKILDIEVPPGHFCLYHHMKMYFANGGRKCTIISAGRGFTKNSGGTQDNYLTDFLAALEIAETLTDENLLLIPEATRLAHAEYVQLIRAMISHCAIMPNRFAILDVYAGNTMREEIEEHRIDVGDENLRFAASYFPNLVSSYTPEFDAHNTICVQKTGEGKQETPIDAHKLREELSMAVRALLQQRFISLPPCSAIAGTYVRVDKDGGIWKASAGIALLDVIEPARRITDQQQEWINVDVLNGKSVNALRRFEGRGTLIWGARTLDGNNTEWRYIPVRRFFSALKKVLDDALRLYVLDANNVDTWQKVRWMIETYMSGIWKQGALQGRTPKEAFFVKVGPGETMTNSDVEEGRMIVEVGIAMVRPSEFIMMRITQQLRQP